MVKGVNTLAGYQVSNSGLNQEDIQDRLSKSKQAVTDNFESNSALKVAAGNTSDPDVLQKTVLLLPPLVLLNRFVDKLIGGSEEKSLLNKAANIGDKISHVLHLDNIVSDKNSSRISNFLKNNRFTKYFTNDYKAIPKSSFAKGTTLAKKYSDELVSNLSDLKYNINFSDLFKQGAGSLTPETLKFYEGIGPLKKAVSIDYLKSVQSALKELSAKGIEDADKLVIDNLQGKISDFMAQNTQGKSSSSTKELASEIAKVLSKFKDGKYSFLRVLSSKPLSKETLNVLDSVASASKDKIASMSSDQIISIADDVISKGVDNVKKGSITSDPIDLSTLRNKLKASDLKLGKTGIGKLFAKGSIKTKDLLTFSGGILGLAFTANAIIQAVKAAKEAPKGEKKSTFMHVLSEQYIGILLFQPSINLLYKASGNKYRGMTVSAREALKNLVEKTNIDENITKEGIEIAKIQRNLLLKGVDENKVADLAGKGLGEVKQLAKSLKKEGTKIKLWEKPLKLMGQILGMGLDKIQKVKFINLPILGRKKMPQPTVKGFLGGLGRFLLILMVIQPFIQKPVTKLCHKIFGEPKAYLAKKNQETQNSSKGNQNNQNSVKNNDIKTSQQYSRLTKQGEETNLLKKYEQKNNTNDSSASTSLSDSKSVSQPLSDERNSQPSAALNLFNKNKSSDRYIPSIEVVDNSAEQEKQMEKMVDEILKSTDVTIKNVKKVL